MSLRPMLASDAPTSHLVRYVEDQRFALEPKLDGHRVVVSIRQGAVFVGGRDGQLSQHAFLLSDRAHRAAYASLPGGTGATVDLDGELIDGVLWVFDLPTWVGHGQDLATIVPGDPFRGRRQALEALFSRWEPDPALFRLAESATTHEAKARLALRIMREQGEGLMAKLLDGKYRVGGKSLDVVKLKFVNDADLVVVRLHHEGRDNAVLGAYQVGADEPTVVGRASTLGKGPIEIDDVVVVRYRCLSPAGKLVNPRIVSRRHDKAPGECLYDQIVTVG